MAATVYVPQVPAKLDRATGLWIPTVNITHAEKFGVVRQMFEQRVSSGVPMSRLIPRATEALKDFRRDDHLVILGDPSLVALCSMIIGAKNGGFMRILSWDRQADAYIPREIQIGNS